ncbi:MAG: S-layer homology domain-containing protein [Bacillus sp. (in: firmicutes)]
MKKLVCSIMTVLLAFSLFVPSISQAASTNSFPDVSSFKEEIEFLTGEGIIFGFSDGTFRPNAPIQRVQAVVMLMRDLKPELGDAPNPGFSDIKPGDFGYEEVAKAVELGIINGKGNNKFDPRGNLTRAEMAIILSRAYELGGIYPKGFSDVSMSSVAYWHISTLAANNITVGYPDGTFRPSQTINRAQFSAFMARILEPGFQPDNLEVADTYLEAIFDMDVIDYAFHPTKPIVYLLDASKNELVELNYDSYEIDAVDFSLPAERITYANEKIYVTQLKGKHSSYWRDDEQEGAFAVVDATTMTQENLIHIDLDPFDIEADDNGVVYISSGSGQHSRIESYDSRTGKVLSSQSILQQNLIAMNPSQNKLYRLNTWASPITMGSYSITEGALNSELSSPYHGTYRITKDLTISPDGKYIFNGSGYIFRATSVDSSDMKYYGKLDRSYNSIAFDVATGELYTASNKNYVQVYDYLFMEPIYQLETYGVPKKMFYNSTDDTLLIFSSVQLGNSNTEMLGLEKIYYDVEM